MKLISMTDFVLEQGKTTIIINQSIRYAHFLNRTLELGMFVPCDLEGNVLEEPLQNDLKYDINISDVETDFDSYKWHEDFVKWDEAKERVLFEGFDRISDRDTYFIIEKDYYNYFVNKKADTNIEKLITNLPFDLTLTESAIKKLGL